MSQDELLAAYASGAVSRRTLIRRLLAAGMTLGAATAYAHLLGPVPARAARPVADLYGVSFSAELVEQALERVIETAAVKVCATASGPTSRTVFIHLYRARDPDYPDATVAVAQCDFADAGTFTFDAPLAFNPPHSLVALKRRKRSAKLGLSFRDGQDPNPFDTAVFRRRRPRR